MNDDVVVRTTVAQPLPPELFTIRFLPPRKEDVPMIVTTTMPLFPWDALEDSPSLVTVKWMTATSGDRGGFTPWLPQ